MRRAIDGSVRRIDCARRVIAASERVAVRRPIRATRQLERVSAWLSDAAARLQCAQIALQDTTESVSRAPENAAGAPEKLMGATLQWLAAAGQLVLVSDRLGDTVARLLQRAKEGHAIDARPVIAPPRPAAIRSFLQSCPSHPSDRIRVFLKRRRRIAPPATADAPKRVSRGRAPPFVSICPL